MTSWKVWLNKPNPSSPSSFQHIGKNALYEGPRENMWKTDSITVIGYARIYNDVSLWGVLNKKKTSHHPMEIIIELYKIYGFETMLDYLDGDFAFVLMDYNILGEEAQLYVTRDPFGIFPLYKMESPDTSCKKVQFVSSEQNCVSEFVGNTSIAEMKASALYIEIPSPNSHFSRDSCIYGFSSEALVLENTSIEMMPNGTYDTFVHSYKVSANWKKVNRENIFYQLPFQSTYSWKKSVFLPPNTHRIQDQMVVAIQKRKEWVRRMYPETQIGVLNLMDKKNKLQPFLSFPFFFSLIDSDFVNIDLPLVLGQESVESEYTDGLEDKYPSILQEIRWKIQSNDPGMIRAHFIPTLVANIIVEKYPDMKVVFMGEAFTYEFLEMNMFDRRKLLKNVYFLEKVRGWTETFLAYGLDIYMPFLDRMLIQTPDQYSRV